MATKSKSTRRTITKSRPTTRTKNPMFVVTGRFSQKKQTTHGKTKGSWSECAVCGSAAVSAIITIEQTKNYVCVGCWEAHNNRPYDVPDSYYKYKNKLY